MRALLLVCAHVLRRWRQQAGTRGCYRGAASKGVNSWNAHSLVLVCVREALPQFDMMRVRRKSADSRHSFLQQGRNLWTRRTPFWQCRSAEHSQISCTSDLTRTATVHTHVCPF